MFTRFLTHKYVPLRTVCTPFNDFPRDQNNFNQPLTDIDVGKPDEVGCVGVEEDVVVAGLVAEQVLHLQPGVAPVQPQRRLQSDELKRGK